MTSEHDPNRDGTGRSPVESPDGAEKLEGQGVSTGTGSENGSARFVSVAPMSAPIVSVDAAEKGVAPEADSTAKNSVPPTGSVRKLVPPPKPKQRDLQSPELDSDLSARPASFPPPSVRPNPPSGSISLKLKPIPTSSGSIKAAASVRPSTKPPEAKAAEPAVVEKTPKIPLAPGVPKIPSFPVPRTSSRPPPTLPSGSTPSSRYPWMSSATAALADGSLPNAVVSRPSGSTPPASASTTTEQKAVDDTNEADQWESSSLSETAPSSSPNAASRAAVLPRATRGENRRSSVPPPRPRLVPSRPPKETPTVAIEAMRIIAIGVEEKAAPTEVTTSSATDAAAKDASSTSTFAPTMPVVYDATKVGDDTRPGGASRSSEVESLAEGSKALAAPRTPSDLAAPSVEPSASVPPAGATSGVDGEAVASMRRPPPPPRRVGFSVPPSEPQITVAEVSTSERDLAVAAAVDASPHEETKNKGELFEVTTELDDDGEAVESVETLESVPPPAAQPVTEAAAASEAKAAQPARVPPPRRQRTEESPEPSTGTQGSSEADKAKARARRPWWEELFNEDFSRAIARLTEHQVEQEVSFIEESLGVAPGAVVLDVGCGAGEHAVELASRGYGLVGYDLSLHQLALAQETAAERGQKLNFLQGDMREMAFEEMFDGVYCWNTTFGYFEEEKNIVVAERMFRALKPGGTLLLDVVNRDYVAMDQPSSVWYEGDSCVCMDDMCIDFLTSRMRVKRSLILDDGRTKECSYSIRLYSLHELGKLLHDIGFRVTEASGHPSTPGVFLGQNSPRIMILAQKP